MPHSAGPRGEGTRVDNNTFLNEDHKGVGGSVFFVFRFATRLNAEGSEFDSSSGPCVPFLLLSRTRG